MANRVAFIRERSELEQWHHVPGSLNPADIASRGLPIRELLVSESWKNGPLFLKQLPEFWPKAKLNSELTEDDTEVVRDPIISVSTSRSSSLSTEWFKNVSDWQRSKNVMAGLIAFQRRVRGEKFSLNEPSSAMVSGEKGVFRAVQEVELSDTIARLKSGRDLKKDNPLRKLCLFGRRGLVASRWSHCSCKLDNGRSKASYHSSERSCGGTVGTTYFSFGWTPWKRNGPSQA